MCEKNKKRKKEQKNFNLQHNCSNIVCQQKRFRFSFTMYYGSNYKYACHTVFGSFSKELRILFDRFAKTVFEREQNSFCH
jgi:hypothetical protein